MKSSRPFSMMTAGAKPASTTSPISSGQLGTPLAFVADPLIFRDSLLTTLPTGDPADHDWGSMASAQTTGIMKDNLCGIASLLRSIPQL
jgi:hypothetical protein